MRGPQFAVQVARAREDALREELQRTLVMEELPAPRVTHLLKRGQYDQPGEEVGIRKRLFQARGELKSVARSRSREADGRERLDERR